MHILTVVSIAASREGGGNAERAIKLAHAFAKQGIKSSLLTLMIGDWQSRKVELNDVKIVALPCFIRRFQVPMPYWSKVIGLVREADVIHLMGYWSFLQVMVCFIAVISGVPWVIAPGGALPIFGRNKFFKKVFNIFIGNHVVRNASGWIAITSQEVADFELYGIDKNQVIIIPNGVEWTDPSAVRKNIFCKNLGLLPQSYILFMGRLSLIKGPDLLLEAFILLANTFPELHLVFAGPDDGMQKFLLKRVAQAGVFSRVHFSGFVEGNQKISAYSDAKLLIVPSRSEAMSIVAIESGMCGTPVLMTSQCGLFDLAEVDPGLIVPATIDGLAAGINYVFSNAEKTAIWGRHWQSVVRERFLWGDISKQMVDWLSTIISPNIKI